jgi:uncharacterized membrane protein YhfC
MLFLYDDCLLHNLFDLSADLYEEIILQPSLCMCSCFLEKKDKEDALSL